MEFHIRLWDRKDDQAFFDFCQFEAYKGTVPNADLLSEEELRRKYEEFDKSDPIDWTRPEHAIFIVETVDEERIGLLWLCHRAPFWRFKEPLVWIYNLYVLPKFRRQGLGKVLLQKTDQWTKEEGLKTIALHVIEWNQGARALYESCGYLLVVKHNESCFYEKRLVD
jgi:GNAT superfamily N-acetyltransferase